MRWEQEPIVIRKYCISLCIFLTFSVFAEEDPTMPADWSLKKQTMVTPKNILLSGIFIHDHQKTAIINGKNISEGEFIEGYEITKINENIVYLRNNSGVFMVSLSPQIVSPTNDSAASGADAQ